MKRWRIVLAVAVLVLGLCLFALVRPTRPSPPDWLPKGILRMIGQDEASNQEVLYYLPDDVHQVAARLRAAHPSWRLRPLNRAAYAIDGEENGACLVENKQFASVTGGRFPAGGTVVQIWYPYPKVVAFFREVAPVLWRKN